ncbi:hypothetical protein A2U01_0035892, partial [Trifolium medium]|nr:hypothetical protein [Trifolium medium]
MDIYPVERNIHLAAAYYNRGKPYLFRINVDVTMCDMKHQLKHLNGPLNCHDARRVLDVEYCSPSVGSNRRVSFTNMKL